MFIIFLLVVAILLIRRGGRRQEAVRLLYKDPPKIADGFVSFACGCRFRWDNPDEEPQRRLCASHRAIIAAEVES